MSDELDAQSDSIPTATQDRAARFIATPAGKIALEVHLWQWEGFRLMTHQVVGNEGIGHNYRVSEETTGFGIPNSFGLTESQAEGYAKAVLLRNRDKLPGAIAALPTLNSLSPKQKSAGRS